MQIYHQQFDKVCLTKYIWKLHLKSLKSFHNWKQLLKSNEKSLGNKSNIFHTKIFHGKDFFVIVFILKEKQRNDNEASRLNVY